jgi:integrase
MAIPGISMQGQLAYSKAMSGTFKFLGWERQELLNLASALRAQGAEIPIEPAVPLLKEDLVRWLRSINDPMLALTAMLAWKTASRWGEMVGLTISHFPVIENHEVIVSWSTLPKGRRKNPYKPSMYTVIRGEWTQEIAELLRRVPNHHPFCPWTTDKLDSELKDVPFMSQYTGHSFKRGAATHLVKEAERRGIEFNATDFSILLKHETTYDLLTSSDLRYTEAGPSLARMLGTQRVTMLLL